MAVTASPGGLTARTVARDGQAAPAKTSLKHRLAEHGVDRVLLLVIPAAVFVLVCFIYPFLYGLVLSLQPRVGGMFASYQAFFSDPYQRSTIWITLRIAIPAALFNVLAAVPIAYKLRGRVKGKRPLSIMLVIPISLGTVLVADGLLAFLGKAGWFNRFLVLIRVVNEPLLLVHNYWGVLMSLIITGFPFAFLLISSYMSGIDPSLESAAAVMGAGWWPRFSKVILPLLAPGLATTFMLTFVLAFSVFPSAYLVGNPEGSTYVLAIAAYKAYSQKYDYSLASAIAIVMGLIELAVLGIVLAWRATLYRGSTGGKG